MEVNNKEVVVYDDLNRAVTTFETFEDGLNIINKADMIRIMSKKAKRSLEEQNRFAEIKLRAERRMGEMLKETPLRGRGGGDIKSSTEQVLDKPTLSDMGILKKQSSRWQKIASYPEEDFEQFIQETKQNNKELTESQLINTVKKALREEEINTIEKEIAEGVRGIEGKFDVIAIDPPWNYNTGYHAEGRRGACPYPEMSYQELKNLVLPAEDDCVLWLWTTHAFIWEAKQLLEDWGFTYKAILVWDKEQMGLGTTLRLQCEFCLLATKGNPKFKSKGVRDIIREGRREHSRKPETFYRLVNSLCVGKKLDYFAREEREGWSVYGIESQKFNKELLK